MNCQSPKVIVNFKWTKTFLALIQEKTTQVNTAIRPHARTSIMPESQPKLESGKKGGGCS